MVKREVWGAILSLRAKAHCPEPVALLSSKHGSEALPLDSTLKTWLKRAKFISEEFQYKAQAPQKLILGRNQLSEMTDYKMRKKSVHTWFQKRYSDPKLTTGKTHFLLCLAWQVSPLLQWS